jgi:hypothetical protein
MQRESGESRKSVMALYDLLVAAALATTAAPVTAAPECRI